MKQTFKRLYLIPLILFTGILLLSSSVFAATVIEPPWFSFSGIWSYDASSDALTTKITTIGTVRYTDGSFDTSLNDTIRGGKFILGTPDGSGGGVIYNGGANSLVFGSSVGGTGNMNLTVFEGSTNYINATMYDFIVTKDGFGTRLNPYYDADHIGDISANNSVGSRFLNEVYAQSNSVGNFYMGFTCSTGACSTNNFTGTASGTLSGGKLSVTPEPVSSILFVTGGAILAFRRYRQKKK